MKLVEQIDQILGTHPQEILSGGQGVKAMILNGLGLVSVPVDEGKTCSKRAFLRVEGEALEVEG